MSPSTWLRAVGLCCFTLVLMALLPLRSDEPKGKKYALLVGVTRYDSKNFTDLKYAGNDADEMEKVLKKAGFTTVRILTSERGDKDGKDAPMAENIRTALKELLAKRLSAACGRRDGEE